jgi:hypothetical protein
MSQRAPSEGRRSIGIERVNVNQRELFPAAVYEVGLLAYVTTDGYVRVTGRARFTNGREVRKDDSYSHLTDAELGDVLESTLWAMLISKRADEA